jgi:chromosome partitioning protein
MKQLFATVDQVKSHFNANLSVLGILTTMVDPRTNICKDMIAAIRDYFKGDVFKSGIKMNVKLIECSLYGEPVITYAPYSVGALSYLELADETLERLHAPVSQTAS